MWSGALVSEICTGSMGCCLSFYTLQPGCTQSSVMHIQSWEKTHRISLFGWVAPLDPVTYRGSWLQNCSMLKCFYVCRPKSFLTLAQKNSFHGGGIVYSSLLVIATHRESLGGSWPLLCQMSLQKMDGPTWSWVPLGGHNDNDFYSPILSFVYRCLSDHIGASDCRIIMQCQPYIIRH